MSERVTDLPTTERAHPVDGLSRANGASADHYRRQLEAVANNATLALFIMDERQHCTFMNPAAERLTGFTLGEVQGRPLHDFVHHTHPDGRPYPLAECPIDRAFPQNAREQGHEVFVHRDGHFYPVAFTASPIREGEQTVGTIIEVQDISDRIRQETEAADRSRVAGLQADVGVALSRSATIDEALRRCCEAIVRHLDAAFARAWVLDAQAGVLELRASAGLYTHLGGPHSRVPVGQFKIGRIAAERIPHLTNEVIGDPQVSDQAWAQREGMVAFAGYPLLVEDRLVGVLALFARHTLSQAVLESLAAIADSVAIAIERDRALQRLREESRTVETLHQVGLSLAAELDLQSLLQSVTDAATTLSGGQFGAFFYNVVNERGEGYQLYTLSGAPREAFERFAMPRNTQVFAPTFAGEGVVRSDDITQDPRYGHNPPYHGMPAGHLPVRSYLAVPVMSRMGEVLGGLFFGHHERGIFGEREERLVVGVAAHAAVAIDNARLYEAERHARSEAEAAVRARDEFLSIASHELRNPLAALKASTQMLVRSLERGRLDGERLERLTRGIGASADRLSLLLEDLLDVSRLRTGQLHLRLRTVDLSSLVREAAARQAHQDPERRIALDLPDAPCEMVVDPDRIEQVVENLLSNALKYSPGGQEVTVGLECREDEAVLTVRDRGIGLPTAHLEAIFEPFGRAPNAAAANIPGMGLGLYICRQIVQSHSGRIWAESAGEGNGTAFHVAIPLMGLMADEPFDDEDAD